MRIDDGDVGIATEGRRSGKRRDGDTRQGVLVGLTVDGSSLDLLRRDVFEGAQETAHLGQAGLRASLLRQPEVGQIGVVRAIGTLARGDEHVRWLHVPVDKPCGVGGIERRSKLGQDGGCEARCQGSLDEALLEVGALDVAHGQVVRALDLARVIDRDDVGVVDGCGELRLAQEARPEGLVVSVVGRQQLERNATVQTGVRGEVHDTHAAAADDRLDVIGPEVRAHTRVEARSRHGAMNLAVCSNQS